MRNLILFFALFSVISCSSDNDNDAPTNQKLVGNWTWKKSTGGINGDTYTPQSTNKTVTLNFSNDQLKVYENETLVTENNYQVQLKPSIMGGNQYMLIYSQDKVSQRFQVDGNKLYLDDECHDCFSSEYEKQ